MLKPEKDTIIEAFPYQSAALSADERAELLTHFLESAERLDSALLALGVDASLDIERVVRKIKVARFDSTCHGVGYPHVRCTEDGKA